MRDLYTIKNANRTLVEEHILTVGNTYGRFKTEVVAFRMAKYDDSLPWVTILFKTERGFEVYSGLRSALIETLELDCEALLSYEGDRESANCTWRYWAI